MLRLRRRTRTLITVLLIGAASLVLVTYFLEIPRSTLLTFLGGSLLFVLALMLLALAAVGLLKFLGKYFR